MFSISIQAGGQSTRMGKNKALMEFNGQPLIERIVERVSILTDDLFITSNHPQTFEYLHIPAYEDVLPGAGALGGLVTAFYYAVNDVVVVLACDLPFINPDLLRAEMNCLLDGNYEVVIPRTLRGLEPLHAVYRVERCLPAALESLRSGRARLVSWLSNVRVREFSLEEIEHYDPGLHSFLNVNTPDEFRQAENLARFHED